MQIIQGFRNAFRIQELRGRILFTLGVLLVYRIGAHIPMPNVNSKAVEAFMSNTMKELGALEGMMTIVSGGAAQNLALFLLGIAPYITASIIMQLMTKVSPALEQMVKEGPAGQRKISQYTRYLTIPICFLQAYFTLNQMVQRDLMDPTTDLFYSTSWGSMLLMVLSVTAGSLFVMWLGEQISEKGIGNGASLLIMSGIVARLPGSIFQLASNARTGAEGTHWLEVIVILALYVGIVFGVVFVTQAQRRIPLQHAKHFRGRRMMMGGRNYMPLRVNTAGVMPVIFASSLLVIPMVIGQIFKVPMMESLFRQGSFFETIFYCGMIFFFSYFWTYLFFQPNEMANNLKEYGSFVPGIRPGETTAKYLDTILARITLCGAAFLCLIARVPDMVSVGFGGDVHRQLAGFLGGTGVLIVVGVALDISQKTESYLLMHHYEGFLGTAGAIRGRRN